MTDNSGIHHEGERKKCVGIYNTAIFGPPEKQGLLSDTGMRFYIDPVTHDLEAAGMNDDDADYADQLLTQLVRRAQTTTVDQFLDWCLGYGNMHNVLGTVRAFADPNAARDSIDPDTLAISEALRSRGM